MKTLKKMKLLSPVLAAVCLASCSKGSTSVSNPSQDAYCYSTSGEAIYNSNCCISKTAGMKNPAPAGCPSNSAGGVALLGSITEGARVVSVAVQSLDAAKTLEGGGMPIRDVAKQLAATAVDTPTTGTTIGGSKGPDAGGTGLGSFSANDSKSKGGSGASGAPASGGVTTNLSVKATGELALQTAPTMLPDSDAEAYKGGGGRGIASRGGSGAGGIDWPSSDGALGTGKVDQQQFDGRVLPPVEAMASSDPEDYFTRLGLEDSIFKTVEKRYQQKAMGWAAAQSIELSK